MNTWWKQHLTSPMINYFGKAKEQKAFTKEPIIIGGCARSGTSLLLSILSAHPAIHAIPVETDAFTEWDNKGNPIRIDRLYRELLFHSIKPSSSRWCEKRPYNVRYIPELLKFYKEQVKFIHIIRDPRSVCTSVHPSKPKQYWVDLDRYIHDVSLGLAYEGHPAVYTIKYEELIADTETEITKLCKFVNEPLVDSMKNWYEHATVRSNRAWFKSLQDIRSDRGWGDPQHEYRVSEIMNHPEMRQLMTRLGYN